MGINDLQLSAEMIAVLYPENLVAMGDPAPAGNTTGPEQLQALKTERYSFSGKNLRSICVLVSTPDGGVMPEEKLVFLQKILEACKCGMDDIALINTYRQPLDLERLKSQFSPRVIFLWGVVPEITGLQNPIPDMSPILCENIIVLTVAHADLMTEK